jgi:hypothetical protein
VGELRVVLREVLAEEPRQILIVVHEEEPEHRLGTIAGFNAGREAHPSSVDPARGPVRRAARKDS